jgi:hypothetical protein
LWYKGVVRPKGFRRLAGLTDERVPRPFDVPVTEASFPIGTRRKWKSGEVVKTAKGWEPVTKAQTKTPTAGSVPQELLAPMQRMAAAAKDIEKASKESPLLGHLIQMGAMMGGSKRPGMKYGSFYEAAAKEGRPYKSEKMPEALKKQVMADIDAIEPQPKQCFYNAQKLALNDPKRYRYVEGFVNSGVGFPIHHGWCVVKDGDKEYVVDPTLREDFEAGFTADNLAIGELPAGREYVGQEFDNELTMKRWRGGMAGSLYDWPPHYPLMVDKPDWKLVSKTKGVDFGD